MFRGIMLSRYVLVEQRDGNFKCSILFPVKGKYKFEVFGKFSDEDVKYSEVIKFLVRRIYKTIHNFYTSTCKLLKAIPS